MTDDPAASGKAVQPKQANITRPIIVPAVFKKLRFFDLAFSSCSARLVIIFFSIDTIIKLSVRDYSKSPIFFSIRLLGREKQCQMSQVEGDICNEVNRMFSIAALKIENGGLGNVLSLFIGLSTMT